MKWFRKPVWRKPAGTIIYHLVATNKAKVTVAVDEVLKKKNLSPFLLTVRLAGRPAVCWDWTAA
jgi:hypothetical protein